MMGAELGAGAGSWTYASQGLYVGLWGVIWSTSGDVGFIGSQAISAVVVQEDESCFHEQLSAAHPFGLRNHKIQQHRALSSLR